MPIYEYACTACGEKTEAKQSFTDPPLETCEDCGGKLRKLYSAVGIVFKGSGFYSNDARKKSKDDSTGGSGSGKKDQKTETKSESKNGSRSDSKAGSSSSSGSSSSDQSSSSSASPSSTSSSSSSKEGPKK